MTPYLYYEDLEAAAAWLADTFGFEEAVRMDGPDGKPVHMEMKLEGEFVMLGHPGSEYRNPKHHDYRHGCVYVKVSDVDAHHAHAAAAGATMSQELADQPYGERNYAADDPEGHRWFFGTPIR